MVLRREVTARIKEVLGKHPEGLSITDLVKSVDINRNTAGRYLENLLLSGQVEMRRFGMSKMYTLTKRLPVSSVLSISSELILQLNLGQRVVYANDPLLAFLGITMEDIRGKNIEFTIFSVVFEDEFPELLERFRRGLKGEEWRGELKYPVRDRLFFCRIAPTVFNEGTKGVSILLDDITDQKRDEDRIRKSEERLRSIFMVSPVGIGVIANRIFLEVNDRFCRITGHTPAELLGNSARMLYRTEEEFRAAGSLYLGQIRQNGFSSIETQWIRKDGAVIDVIMNAAPLDPADPAKGLTFTVLDITERKRAEQALRASEERLSLALSASETGMWEMDFPDGRGSIDENAAAILGFEKSEIGTLRYEWDSLTHPDDVPLVAQRIADYLEGRAPMFESEHRMRHKDGHWVWVAGRGKITQTSADGSVKRISGTLKDITTRKSAERALRESETKLQLALDGSELGLWEVEFPSGRGFGDDRCSAIFGFTARETMGGSQDWMALTHPDDLPLVRQRLADHLAGLTPMYESEHRMRHASGRWIWVIGRGKATPPTPDGTRRILGTMLDVTRRREAEEAVRESEETARALLEAPTDTILLVDTHGMILDLNENAVNRFGRHREELVGSLLDTFLPVDLAKERRRKITEVLTTGKPLRFPDQNGDTWFDNVAYPIKDKDGNVARIAIIARDITDLKRAEVSLRESEEKYRHVVEQSLQGLTVIQNGRHVYFNPAMLRILGYSPEEYSALDLGALFEAVHPDDRDRVQAIATDNLAGRSISGKAEFRFARKDGQIRWILAEGIRMIYNGKPAIQVAFFDFTDRRNAEESLRKSEEKYRNLVERSLQGLTVIQNGRPVFANTEMLEIGGYASMGEYLALSASDLMATIHPDDRVRIRKVMADRLAGKNIPAENEFRILRADGQVRWVLTRGALIEYNNAPAIQVTYFDITSRRKAEQALAESEERLRQIAETLTNGVFYMYDRVSNQFIYVSPAYEKIWGRSCRSLYDDPFTYLEAVHPEDKPRLWENIRHELEEGVYIDTEYRILQPGGTVRWIHSRNFPVSDPDGTVNRVAGMAEDITDRRIAEDALRESEDRYRKLVEISPNAVLLHQDGKVIYANQALAGILGAGRPEDLIGKDVLDLVHPDYRAAVRANISRDLAGEMSPFTELQLIRKDGAAVLVEGQGVGTTIGGRPAVLVSITDITESCRAEQALRESGERYRTLAEASRDLIFVIGRNDCVEYVNSYSAEMLGISPDKIIGKERSSFFSGERDKRQSEELQRIFETGIPLHTESPMPFSGSLRWFDHYLMPIIDAQGTVTAVLGVSRDISERRKAEQATRESESLYRTLAEASQDLIFVIGRDDRVEYVNSYAAAAFGLSATQLIGRGRAGLFTGETGARQKAGLEQVFRTGRAVRSEGPLDLSGTIRWYDHFLMPVTDSENRVTSVLGISRDITDRKDMEQKLRANEERYRSLLEQTFDAVAIHKDGRIAFLNERAARILGAAAPEELIGRPILDLIHPDSYKDLQERLKIMAADPSRPVPVLQEKFFRVDGTIVSVDVMAVRLPDDGNPAAIRVFFRESPGQG